MSELKSPEEVGKEFLEERNHILVTETGLALIVQQDRSRLLAYIKSKIIEWDLQAKEVGLNHLKGRMEAIEAVERILEEVK